MRRNTDDLAREVVALEFVVEFLSEADINEEPLHTHLGTMHNILRRVRLELEGLETLPPPPTRYTPPPHKQSLTTFDRDDRPISPTCAFCGRPEALCNGDK